MSRHATFQTIALFGLLATQAWLIYRIEHPKVASPEAAMTFGAPPPSQATLVNPGIAAQASEQTAMLARIDARLAVLQRATPAGEPRDPPPRIVAGSPEARAADRTLAAMLPSAPMTPTELIAFQSRFADFPPDQQAQLSAALARAINGGRVQTRSE